MSLKRLWCQLTDHKTTMYEKTHPNGDTEMKVECDRCGAIIYGAMTATAPE